MTRHGQGEMGVSVWMVERIVGGYFPDDRPTRGSSVSHDPVGVNSA